MAEETSWGHRSDNWGDKFHVDLIIREDQGNVVDQSHGHSPTLSPPPMDSNAIKIKSPSDLPAPYGKI